MSVQVQRRGGTTAEHKTFTGASREITVDTVKKTLVVHDAVKKGGYPLAREDLSNVGAKLLFDKISELIPDFLSLIIPTGIVLQYSGKLPPNGFLLYDGKTLGNEISEADFIGDQYKALYIHQWENLNYVEIDGGKGMGAIEDWEAGKKLKLPDARRKMIVGAFYANDIFDRQLGMTGGEENHKLTLIEMPIHSHFTIGGSYDAGNVPNNPSGSIAFMRSVGQGGLQNENFEYTLGTSSAEAYQGPTNQIGGNTSHNNMPPWLALNFIVKL